VVKKLRKFSNNTTINGDFSGIKKSLDSSKSYIIFENNLKKGKNPFKYLQKENYPWQQVIDRDMLKQYLVIQVAPGNEDEVLGKVIGYGLAEDTVYYIFKAGQD
jgi:hypothetical protein